MIINAPVAAQNVFTCLKHSIELYGLKHLGVSERDSQLGPKISSLT